MGKSVFQDPDFRQDYSSIVEVSYNGTTYNDRDISRVVDWRRLKDLKAFTRATSGHANVKLFEDGVRAGDINQGSLGDCWLLSSLACLASRAGAVEKLFLTPEYNEEGRYQIRLWDKQAKQYKDVVVDDGIPVWRATGDPCFSRPSGNEAWVLVLEKAMAKFVGNYHFLHGGVTAWALETLTGHYTCAFLLDVKYGPNQGKREQMDWKWIRAEMATKPQDRVIAFGAAQSPVKRAALYMFDEKDETKYYEHDEVFYAVVYHLAIGNLIACATIGDNDDESVQGVVRAHAYTVMQAAEVDSAAGPLRMIQVRNPHGAGGIEWTGNWSDGSPAWGRYPEVAQALRYSPPGAGAGDGSLQLDGMFWMVWEDFCQHFKEVTFCCSRGFDYVEEQEQGWVEQFNDPAFPHDFRSLGDYKFIYGGNPMIGKQLDEIIKWLRLKEIAAPDQFRRGARGLKLFSGGIHPDDIDGSASGLMVATACMANKPGAIEEAFLVKEYKADGRYQVRLYDPKTGQADITPFDDWIPCFNGVSISKTKILGSEVWVLLLEKAVARMVNSYSKVSMWGVQVSWAFAALTGEYTTIFSWEDGKKKWRRMELEFVDKDPGKYRATYTSDATSLVDSERLFQTICCQLVVGCLVAAETDRQTDRSASTGLAMGRTYSVLDARAVALRTPIQQQPGGQDQAQAQAQGAIGTSAREVKLIKLRDPGRVNEWVGPWSDSSPLWEQHPEVREALDQPPAPPGAQPGSAPVANPNVGPGSATSSGRPDGAFWMTFDDFVTYYRNVTMCGNSLRNNNTPWQVDPQLLARQAARLEEARRQQRLQAQQEALEEALADSLKARANERRNGAKNMAPANVFTQAARQAAEQAPRRDQPPPPPAAAAAVGGAAAAAGAGKPGVVVVDYKGCKACAIM